MKFYAYSNQRNAHTIVIFDSKKLRDEYVSANFGIRAVESKWAKTQMQTTKGRRASITHHRA